MRKRGKNPSEKRQGKWLREQRGIKLRKRL
jgi:hypothetical protein